MLQTKGLGVLYCGKWNNEDENSLNKTLTILGGEIIERRKILLPRNKGTRNIICIQPNRACPDTYPRNVGKPEKKPLSR